MELANPLWRIGFDSCFFQLDMYYVDSTSYFSDGCSSSHRSVNVWKIEVWRIEVLDRSRLSPENQGFQQARNCRS